MTDIEVDYLVKKLEKYEARVTKSKKKSKEFLIGAGIITPDGNLTSPYNPAGSSVPLEPKQM